MLSSRNVKRKGGHCKPSTEVKNYVIKAKGSVPVGLEVPILPKWEK
jgi:hypothetical protein